MSDDDRAEAVASLGLTHEQMCYRLGEAWHELDALRARLAKVEALCMRSEWAAWAFAKQVLAAARGEGGHG